MKMRNFREIDWIPEKNNNLMDTSEKMNVVIYFKKVS